MQIVVTVMVVTYYCSEIVTRKSVCTCSVGTAFIPPAWIRLAEPLFFGIHSQGATVNSLGSPQSAL